MDCRKRYLFSLTESSLLRLPTSVSVVFGAMTRGRSHTDGSPGGLSLHDCSNIELFLFGLHQLDVSPMEFWLIRYPTYQTRIQAIARIMSTSTWTSTQYLPAIQRTTPMDDASVRSLGPCSPKSGVGQSGCVEVMGIEKMTHDDDDLLVDSISVFLVLVVWMVDVTGRRWCKGY